MEDLVVQFVVRTKKNMTPVMSRDRRLEMSTSIRQLKSVTPKDVLTLTQAMWAAFVDKDDITQRVTSIEVTDRYAVIQKAGKVSLQKTDRAKRKLVVVQVQLQDDMLEKLQDMIAHTVSFDALGHHFSASINSGKPADTSTVGAVLTEMVKLALA